MILVLKAMMVKKNEKFQFDDFTCQNASIPESNISDIGTAEAFRCKAFVLKGSSILQTLKQP
jgi:hypothetical protein